MSTIFHRDSQWTAIMPLPASPQLLCWKPVSDIQNRKWSNYSKNNLLGRKKELWDPKPKKKQIWWEHKKDKFIDQHYQLELSGDSNILRIKYGSHSTRVVVENQDFSSMTEESIVFNINLNALISHIARDYYTQHESINYVHFYISLVWDMVFI